MACRPGIYYVFDEDTLFVDGKKYEFSPETDSVILASDREISTSERSATGGGGQLTLSETYKWKSKWKIIRNKT